MKGMIVDWIAHQAANRAQHRATIELPSGRVQTYAEMHVRVGRIAQMLVDRGVERGDRVGMLALNSQDTLDVIFATWRIGAIHLALNFRLTPSELDFIIGNAEPRLLIHDRDLKDTVDALTVPVGECIETDGQGGASRFEESLVDVEPLLETVDLEPEDPCMLMYSSGTTGRPKGVIMTHGMMIWANVNAAASFKCDQDMVSLSVMPLFHIGGLQLFASPALCAGGTAIVMRTFDPGKMLAVVSDPDLGVSHFLGVPAIFNALRDHPDNAKADFSRLAVVIAGAEAVPVSLVRWWGERGVVIQEGYGMTENVASCMALSREDVVQHVGSAGKPLRHTQVRVSRDDGSEAAPGESGELWCRGPVVTPGYWRNPEANAESFVDGWFRTGDIGSKDAEGFFYIEDRLKDMYISGGENVYPAEVENVLYEMTEIREVAVIGLPDERWGEAGWAVVALQEGQSLEPEALFDFCRSRLARFKQPVRVEFVDELPRNATGKVLKFELRQQFAPPGGA